MNNFFRSWPEHGLPQEVYAFFLAQNFGFWSKNPIFAICPNLVNDPFLALGMTVNYTNELGCQGENPATSQCIFSSQLGQGRTTLGMTVACIVKAVLMSTKLNKMVETGIGSPEWAENIRR